MPESFITRSGDKTSFTSIRCCSEPLAPVFTPDPLSHAARRGWAALPATPTFPQPGCLSPQGDVGLDWGLVILDHPAGKLAPLGLGLCRPHVLQRVGPVRVPGDLRGLHGLDSVPVLHPGEVQAGGVEVALSLIHI